MSEVSEFWSPLADPCMQKFADLPFDLEGKYILEYLIEDNIVYQVLVEAIGGCV